MIFVLLSAICLLAFVYPFALYPLLLLLLRKQGLAVPSDAVASRPRVALLFCAYNEERVLPSKIQNIREIKATWPDIDVRVYTDCCTDASVAQLRAADDVLTVHEGHIRTGKAAGMRMLVEATEADIVIFTDAAVILEPVALTRLVSYFSDPLVGTVAGTLHYTNHDESQSAKANSLYWRLEETIKRLESETGSTMGASGQVFATRRSLYPVVPADLLDDMIASINPIFHGYRVISVPDVRAFQRATSDGRDEIYRKRRIACRAFNTHRHLRPQLRAMSLINRFKYTSHKYVRWFSAAFLVLGTMFGLIAIAVLGGIGASFVSALVGGALLMAGLRWRVPVVGTLAEIAMGTLATGLGVAEAMAGRSYQTWTPAKSRRQRTD